MFTIVCISNTDAEWPGLRTWLVPFLFLGGKRDYPEISHTCWNNAVITDTASSCKTLTRSPSHSMLSVVRIIRLYRNVDVDNRNMSMGHWYYNLWHRERWVLRTCPVTTLSTTNSTLSALGLNPGHNRERPATKRLSNGTANLMNIGDEISNGSGVRVLHCLVSGFWHSYSELNVFWPCIMNWLYINYQLDALIIIYS